MLEKYFNLAVNQTALILFLNEIPNLKTAMIDNTYLNGNEFRSFCKLYEHVLFTFTYCSCAKYRS